MRQTDTQTLYTRRLILRAFTQDDLPALFQIFGEQNANTFLPWYPLRSFAEARAFFEERYAQQQGYQYAICLRCDNVPIGYINISADEARDLGYGLREAFWGRGIAAEAGSVLLEAAQKDGVPYVTATHDRDNPRSGRVMEKLGMQYQYTYEEHWQPKDKLVTFRLYQRNLDGNADRVYQKYWQTSVVHYVEPLHCLHGPKTADRP